MFNKHRPTDQAKLVAVTGKAFIDKMEKFKKQKLETLDKYQATRPVNIRLQELHRKLQLAEMRQSTADHKQSIQDEIARVQKTKITFLYKDENWYGNIKAL